MRGEKIKILYIDDEVNNLNVFKATFREDYIIFLSSSAAHGVDILRNNEIHIIIADHKMPGMTGVDFFEMILKEFPDPIRILITGYSNIESVIAAINKGQVYRYIPKPWSEQELRLSIENAFEIYDIRKQLENTNVELTKRNEELNRFVYSASHELKAPIKTIEGIIQMANENKAISSDKYFEMIEKCVKNLDVFIKSIIEYHRNQKQEGLIKSIYFKTLIEEKLEEFKYFDGTSDIHFDLSVNQNDIFMNDELRIKIILNNLISNAIKYQKKISKEKKVSVIVNVDKDTAYIEIGDNGIGIPSDYIDKIFNMFYRATDHSSGSGIGLYIVKEAVEKLNGAIKVHSKDNEGATFKVIIPNLHI